MALFTNFLHSGIRKVAKCILPLLIGNAAVGQVCLPAPMGCASSDYSNAFIYSSNPATLEFDNIVSSYHATGYRRSDGKFFVWGAHTDPTYASSAVSYTDGNLLVPTEINSTTFSGLTGTPLKYTAGSNGTNSVQHILLATDGLYAWGTPGQVVSSSITNTGAFNKITVNGKSDGLPTGVTAADVKMMQASNSNLCIVTCDGRAFVLTTISQNRGDGGTSTSTWSQVKKSATANDFLTNVIQMRIHRGQVMALTSENKLYTWGYYTYRGNGSGMGTLSLNYATEMSQPGTGAIKMIGIMNNSAAYPTYVALMANGTLYTLGSNTSRQVGDPDVSTLSNLVSWGQVKRSSGVPLTNVAWISPNEHDLGSAVINVITTTGELWSWGDNARDMLGITGTADGATGTATNPTKDHYLKVNGGSVTGPAFPEVFAVETGGHTSISILKCQDKYAYAGHDTNGSYGDGTSPAFPGVYRGYYEIGTSLISLKFCGIDPTATAKIDPFNQKICAGSSYQLTASPQGGTWSIVSGSATINATTGLLSVTAITTPIVVKFTNALACTSTEDELTIYPYDWGNLDPAKWDKAAASIISTGLTGVWAGTFTSLQRADAECTTATADEADGLALSGGTGTGTLSSPWVVVGASTKTFTLEVAGTQTGAQYGVWIDMDDDGHFTGAADIFVGGFTTLSSNVGTSSIPITFPNGVSGTRGMRVLVGGITENPAARALATWTKASMIPDFTIQNGEVEDYYLSMVATVNVSGNVFNDLDALVNDNIATSGSTNNSPTNAGGLYANLLDASGNVVATATIATDGTYSFAGVAPGSYSVQITTNQGTVGQTAPVTALPTNWVNTGDKNGTGTGVDGTGTAGADGTSALFTVTTTDVTNVNFGIQQLPTPNEVTLASSENPGGTVNSPDVSTSFGGTDPDGGIITAIKITAFPTGATSITIDGVTYTDLADIQTAYPNGIPTNSAGQPTVSIAVDPTPGDVTVNIPYVTVDNAGQESPTEGFVKIPFTAPMPVHLISFNILKEGEAVSIKWSTTSEENFKGFQIERSANAKTWNPIKYVDSKIKNNQNGAVQNYHYTDVNPLAGANYYRLKMVDLDDTFANSTIRSVRFDQILPADVYPNPVSNKLYIKTTSGKNKVSVINMQGQTVFSGVVNNEVDFTKFMPGLYIIKITDEKGRITQQKVVKP